jgi:hypothetical protein
LFGVGAEGNGTGFEVVDELEDKVEIRDGSNNGSGTGFMVGVDNLDVLVDVGIAGVGSDDNGGSEIGDEGGVDVGVDGTVDTIDCVSFGIFSIW